MLWKSGMVMVVFTPAAARVIAYIRKWPKLTPPSGRRARDFRGINPAARVTLFTAGDKLFEK